MKLLDDNFRAKPTHLLLWLLQCFFQLLYLDRIPVYAAIGESVELAKSGSNKFAAGMVNAILRKIAAQAKPDKLPDATNSAELAMSAQT